MNKHVKSYEEKKIEEGKWKWDTECDQEARAYQFPL